MEDAKNIAKNYNPAEFEDKLYNEWVEKGYFHAEVDKNKKPFTIVIPPPNVTGQLHMGHALDETLQDILIRYKRMQGYSALWIPGTDHAGIATQIKVEENLRVNEGLLVKVEDHSHNVGQCYRCGTTVEPIVSKQWFVKMKPLAQPRLQTQVFQRMLYPV